MSDPKQRLRYPELAPQGIAAMSAVEHYLNAESGLEAVLIELVRLRCSQLNGCEYCIALHTAELIKHHEPRTRMDAVTTWPQSDAFTERERAALAWAEHITNIQQGHAEDAAFTAVRRHFTDAELVNLTLAIASINAFNRMAIAFRPQWHQRRAPDATDATLSPEDDDGGKAAEDA